MSIATAICFATAVAGVVVAVVAYGLGAAPGWRELRWFAAIALTGGLYGAADTMVSIDVPDRWVTWGSMSSLFFAGLHCSAWQLYMAQHGRRSLSRSERLLVVALLAFAALALVPGALVSSRVEHHAIPWLGMHLNDAIPTPLGGVCFATYSASFVVPLVRFGRAWRAGQTGAAAHVLGVGALFVAAINDALAGAALTDAPYLLSLAFMVLVGATAVGLVTRIVEGARELDRLSTHLERTVEERTAALARSQEALSQAERLAALGELATGVAHEINNPAFAIVCDLDYLRDHSDRTGQLPPDARECLDQSRSSMDRIVRVVRQLLDAAGATADPRATREPPTLGQCLEAALREARRHVPEEVAIAIDAPGDVVVAAPRAALEQVLTGLVVNAGQAIRSVRDSGSVHVTARTRGGRIVVTVRDDGPGIPPEVQSKMFEPFFSTKGPGEGIGLGLAVARGLVRSLGGDLRLAETSPAGTVMEAELPAGA